MNFSVIHESEYDSLAVSQNKCVMANASMDIKDEELETKGDNEVKELEILKSTQKKHQNSII